MDIFVATPAWTPLVVAGLVWLAAWHYIPGPGGGEFGGLFAVVIMIVGLRAALERRRLRRLVRRSNRLDDLRSLKWREFEDLVAEAYRHRGYRVEPTARGTDGGVDLIARRDHQTTLIQCKRWKHRQVRVSTVRELLGVMTAERADAGVVVTCGEFTPEAIAFVRGAPITLMDGPALLAFLGREPIRPGNAPFAAPAAPSMVMPADHAPTQCPLCGKGMVLRTSQYGAFYGCSTYPRCRGKRNIA